MLTGLGFEDGFGLEELGFGFVDGFGLEDDLGFVEDGFGLDELGFGLVDAGLGFFEDGRGLSERWREMRTFGVCVTGFLAFACTLA